MSHQALVPGPPSESPTRLGCQESPSPADPGATGPGNRHSNSSPSQAGRGGQGPASLSSGARPRSRFALPAGGPRPSAPEVMRLSWPACILLPRFKFSGQSPPPGPIGGPASAYAHACFQDTDGMRTVSSWSHVQVFAKNTSHGPSLLGFLGPPPAHVQTPRAAVTTSLHAAAVRWPPSASAQPTDRSGHPSRPRPRPRRPALLPADSGSTSTRRPTRCSRRQSSRARTPSPAHRPPGSARRRHLRPRPSRLVWAASGSRGSDRRERTPGPSPRSREAEARPGLALDGLVEAGGGGASLRCRRPDSRRPWFLHPESGAGASTTRPARESRSQRACSVTGTHLQARTLGAHVLPDLEVFECMQEVCRTTAEMSREALPQVLEALKKGVA